MPIFDQGYQHWSGHLSNHAWRWLAITRRGFKTGLKLPRLKWILFIAWMPALLLIAFLCAWGLIEQKSSIVAPIMPLLKFLGPEVLGDPRLFRVTVWTLAYTYFMDAELWLAMLLVVIVGPNLISQDLRFNALPLYFSRPLRRFDYFLGKLGVIGAFLGMVMVVPALIAYILGMLFSLDITIIGDTLGIVLGAVAYGLVIVVSSGSLILALSSLARNSRYVSIMWVVIWFVTMLLSAVLVKANQAQIASAYYAKQSARQSEDGNGFRSSSAADEFEDEFVTANKTDWRPLISYMGNLRRIGRQFLGTDAAWDHTPLIQAQPFERRGSFRAHLIGPEYPWYWSFGVLAALFGLSLCILHFRVRSLDRLK